MVIASTVDSKFSKSLVYMSRNLKLPSSALVVEKLLTALTVDSSSCYCQKGKDMEFCSVYLQLLKLLKILSK